MPEVHRGVNLTGKPRVSAFAGSPMKNKRSMPYAVEIVLLASPGSEEVFFVLFPPQILSQWFSDRILGQRTISVQRQLNLGLINQFTKPYEHVLKCTAI